MLALTLRTEVQRRDREAVAQITAATNMFHPPEVAVAVELVDDRLKIGAQSDYKFVFAELDHRAVGYTSYGPIALTAASYDLYWIAVDKACHGQKIGWSLMKKTEELIHEAGGQRVYIETSSRHPYAPTRGFYLRCGYREEARLKDFYAPGDDKVIYVRELQPLLPPIPLGGLTEPLGQG